MKKEALLFACIGMFLLGMGYLLGKQEGRVQNVFPAKYHTEDMKPVSKKADVITLVFIDSAEGRPTYCVEFNDSTLIDSMYPEEIANGLVTGKWTYNEMLTLTEKP